MMLQSNILYVRTNLAQLEIKSKSQSGVALIISLLFLIIISLVSIAGLQGVALQEKMTSGTYDRNIALQSAEAVLRIGETIAEAQSKTGPYNDDFPNNGVYTDADDDCPDSSINNCSNGLCATPDKDCMPRWELSTFNQWVSATGLDLEGLSDNVPEYLIEYLGGNFDCYDGGSSDPKNCHRYRIIVRSDPSAERAAVLLESIYATD